MIVCCAKIQTVDAGTIRRVLHNKMTNQMHIICTQQLLGSGHEARSHFFFQTTAHTQKKGQEPSPQILRMQLVVIKHNSDALAAIEVPSDADVELLIQMIQSEMGIPLNEQRLEFEDAPLRAGSLLAHGVVDGSTIIVKQVSAPLAGSSAPLSPQAQQPQVQQSPAGRLQLVDPSSVPPERMLEIIAQNPGFLQQYKRLDAELGAILEARDVGKLRVWIMKRAMSRHKIVYEARMEEIALENADPMDPEVQKKIAEKVGVLDGFHVSTMTCEILGMETVIMCFPIICSLLMYSLLVISHIHNVIILW